MRVSGVKERYFLLKVAPIKKNDLLRGCAEHLSGLESQAERGTRNLGDQDLALLKPRHVAPVHVLRADQPVPLPGVIVDQMAGQHFVSEALQELHKSPGR